MNTHCLTYSKALFPLLVMALNLPGADVNAATPLLPQRAPLFAHLLGGNEVSSTGDANAGDPDGAGSATVMFKSATTLCYAILMSNLDTPIAAHIHRALAGVNGGVVLTLSVPANGNPGTVSGCIPGLESDFVSALRNNPSGYYINVHTTIYPNGAIRGQLF